MIKTLTSCDPGIFSREFNDTFTGVLSAVLHREDSFIVSWRLAVESCRKMAEAGDDINFPDPEPKSFVGVYTSRSGNEYYFYKEYPDNKAPIYCIQFPENTSLNIEKIYQDELNFVGHKQCVALKGG